MSIGYLVVAVFSGIALGTVAAGLLGFLGDDDDLDY